MGIQVLADGDRGKQWVVREQPVEVVKKRVSIVFVFFPAILAIEDDGNEVRASVGETLSDVVQASHQILSSLESPHVLVDEPDSVRQQVVSEQDHRTVSDGFVLEVEAIGLVQEVGIGDVTVLISMDGLSQRR
jgi:hypothetical protein